jgi:hypothetical protein
MDKEILLNQFIEEFLKRTIPSSGGNQLNFLSLTLDKNLEWVPNTLLSNNGIFPKDGRLGIGRNPLFTYQVDIAVPKDTLMTAFHIGDGSFGFSLGNGTAEGFVPEIIGVGSDQNDPGLYFLGIAGNNISSDTPLLVFDGRNVDKKTLVNRPIMGIKSGEKEYDLLLDASGNLKIKNDVILGNASLLNIIYELKKDIEDLKTKINETE